MLSGSRSTWHPYVCRGRWSWTPAPGLCSSVGISQGHIPDTTSASGPESLDLWKGTRKAGFPRPSAGRGYPCSVPASRRCLSQSYSQAGVLGVHLHTRLGCSGDARKALSHLSHTRSTETGFSPSGTLRKHLSLRLSCWWWPDWAVSFTQGPSGCRLCTELAFGAPCSAGASPASFCPPIQCPWTALEGSSQNYCLSLISTPTPLTLCPQVQVMPLRVIPAHSSYHCLNSLTPSVLSQGAHSRAAGFSCQAARVTQSGEGSFS